MRRNGETLQADGSGKLYRKETNFPNSWMNTRTYTLRIFLVTITTLWMMPSMGALRCPTKVYTLPRRSMDFRRDTVFGRMSSTDLTQAIQSTEALHISIPCNSETHKVITSGETGACAGQMASVCNLKILPATAGDAAGQAANIVVRPEDTAAANLVEEASCFRRATDSTESLDDTAPAAVSSPWRPASLPFSFFETPYKFTGRWFRQITPLGIRNARSPGTNLISKAPRLAHSLRALGPTPNADPQLFQRAAEVALGVSFNAQSQAPDIPGASSRAVFLRHTASLQAQSKAPDLYALRAYTEELLGSLNAQAQVPDDPSPALLDFQLLSLRAYMEMLSDSFNDQEQ